MRLTTARQSLLTLTLMTALACGSDLAVPTTGSGSLQDGIIGGLRNKTVVFVASNMGSMLEGFAFNLQPWARTYLEENPGLLNGFAGAPQTPQEKLLPKGW